MDSSKVYTLAELIDVAERQNPATRAAWNAAKAAAQNVGISEAALYPTIEAAALASTTRFGDLMDGHFHRITEGVFYPDLSIQYLLFDFGARHATIENAKAAQLGANLAFNDVHRNLIASVMFSYYSLLKSTGQLDAAQANLANAQAVQRDAEKRLEGGLATRPDALEAQAASAQAQYDLQAALGAQLIAKGNLSTALAINLGAEYQVQGIADLVIPDSLQQTLEEATTHALQGRPDLQEKVAQLRGAEADIRRARSDYFPALSFSGTGGVTRAYGQQDFLPGTFAGAPAWTYEMSLKWTVFDGLRREHAVAEAKAQRDRIEAEIDSAQDEIANEVWAAYSNATTALRQRQAATALLESADASYNATLKSYNYGLRSLLDVIAAQKALAQARTADVSARADVLNQFANLAFRTGDLIRSRLSQTTPKAQPGAKP